MTGLVIQLVRSALKRLVDGRVPVGLWLLLLAGPIVSTPLFFLPYIFDSDLRDIIVALVAIVALLLFALITLIALWKLTRTLADHQNRQGDFFAWVGWGIVSYLPMFIGVLVMYRLDPNGQMLYLESLASYLPVAFTVPLLVHATGRAIDESGPVLGGIWSFWSRDYAALIFAFLLMTLPLSFLGDMTLLAFGEDGYKAVTGNLIAMLFYLGASVLNTALTVEAFHRVEQGEASVRQS